MSGSWTIDRAVKSRWDERNLTQTFRAFWPDPSETGSPVFNSGDARPGCRMPYVVFSKIIPIKTGESTAVPGEGGLAVEYWTQQIQFTIHATVTTNPRRSPKEVCEILAKEIVAAYEDEAGALDLEDDDCHIETVVGPDFDQRKDDDVWMWALLFDVNFERRRRLRGVS